MLCSEVIEKDLKKSPALSTSFWCMAQEEPKENCGASKLVFPESISIRALLNAGKLIKPVKQQQEQMQLEEFDLGSGSWMKKESTTFTIDWQKFASGAQN
eukprot:gene13133-14484_t